MNPLANQIIHAAFPEVASALRARIEAVVLKWDKLVREVLPQMDRLTIAEMRDSFPKILTAVAAALESPDPAAIENVIGESPVHGLTRFYQRYGVIEVSQENRLLRGVIVLEVEEELGRRMTSLEGGALHATIDVMLLQAVMALVEEKERHLRQTAERELKYLTFLSHDMNNNLGSLTLQLKLLEQELTRAGLSADSIESLATAKRAIDQTAQGMRQLLDHERLRKGPGTANRSAIDLVRLLKALAMEFASTARAKGLELAVDADPACVARTDAGLVSLVVRNLIGNAVKYSRRGKVQVRCQCEPAGETGASADADAGGAGRSDAMSGRDGRRWLITISDQGPGMAPEHLERIFDAFSRGESHGQDGVGLGLAIAAQAARVLGAELTVESTLGQGSTFALRLAAE